VAENFKSTESAGGVVLNKQGLVLVVNQHGSSWSLPKGHIEPGEDKLAAALREIYEESGISKAEYVKDLGHYCRYKIGKNGDEDRTEFKKIYIFLFKTDLINLNPSDPHNPEARWVDKEEVSSLLTHPKDKEFFIRIKHLI